MLKFHKCKCLATKKGIFAAKMQQWSVEKAPVESLYSKLIQMKICFLDLGIVKNSLLRHKNWQRINCNSKRLWKKGANKIKRTS